MELKPCKCGAKPRYVVFESRNRWLQIHQVDCPKHPSKPIPVVRAHSEAKVREAWNSRVGEGENK